MMTTVKAERFESHRVRAVSSLTEAADCPLTIAIVDDDPSIRRALLRLLEAEGFRCVAFASAEDYLAHESSENFHCLILDVQLSGMSGPQLCAKLARSECSIAIIFLTASDDGAADGSILAGEANAVLQKPVDAAQLADALTAHCTSRHQMCDVARLAPTHGPPRTSDTDPYFLGPIPRGITRR